MALLKKRKTKVEVEEKFLSSTRTQADPGFPVRIVDTDDHRLLMLAYEGTPETLVRDFAAKSRCDAWFVDFDDPTLNDRIEAWRKG